MSIVVDVTLGIVFAFCAMAVVLIMPIENLFRRKGKQDK